MLFRSLQRAFLLRSCSDSTFALRTRPCLLHQIKRCSAPCVGRIDGEGYRELVGDAKKFLAGKTTDVQAKLGAQMQAAAENMDFELAAVLRDRLKALTFIQGTQFINAEGVGDADIFALACLEGVIGIQAFFIRGGQNWGHRSFFPSHTAEVSEEEVLQLFLMQFYEEVPPARTIFAVVTIWPACRAACSAACTMAPITVAGNCARPIGRASASVDSGVAASCASAASIAASTSRSNSPAAGRSSAMVRSRFAAAFCASSKAMPLA
mgnify:CR=1 FL=1